MDNISYWTETLTVYTGYVDAGVRKWNKCTVKNCFYSASNERQFADYDTYLKNPQIARIPPQDIPVNIASGSIIVRGSVDDYISDGNSGNDLLRKYKGQCFTVNIYRDNTARPWLPHYYVSGA